MIIPAGKDRERMSVLLLCVCVCVCYVCVGVERREGQGGKTYPSFVLERHGSSPGFSVVVRERNVDYRPAPDLLRPVKEGGGEGGGA